ncbi:MAG: DUF6460 domain-containing protein [Notoacmeibacter sp.]
MYGFFAACFKIIIASLLAGAALHALNFSADDILNNVGLTPEKLFELLQKGWKWALPNIMLGSLVILPLWFVVALLRPPRARD